MKIEKQKIILDVDTGSDDALAILLAIQSTRFEIQGISTCFGNTSLKQVILNTFKILNLADRLDIPVFRGSLIPLRGKGRRGRTSGKDGLCDVFLPSPDRKAQQVKAEKFILETVLNYQREVIIIATAPLTNIAKVLKQNPEIKKKVKRIFVMGGAIEVSGNITPFAEFNFFNDPEAAKIVLGSGVPLALIPLDVTTKLLVTRDWLLKKYGQYKDPITKFIVNLVNNRYRLAGKDWFYLHDPLAVGVAINKNFVETKKERLRIITEGKEKGRVTKDNQGQEIEWAFKVKEKEFLKYFERLLLRNKN